MQTTTQLYWLTRLDSLSTFFGLFMFIGIFIFLGLIMFYISGDIEYKENKKSINIFLISFLISIIGSIFIPTKEEVIFIVAGGKVIEFTKTDSSINKIPAQATKLITDYLDKQLENKNK